MSDYKRPQVWEWDTPNDQVTGNKPTAGSRFELELPRGDKPYQLYSLGTPNGIKIPIMFEELVPVSENVGPWPLAASSS